MNAWIALAFGLAGFAALSLAMERHQAQVFGRPLARAGTLRWRLAGIALLGLSLAACLMHWRTSVALAAWLGVLTPAGLAVAWLLTYRPRRLPPVAWLALALGAVGLVLAW